MLQIIHTAIGCLLLLGIIVVIYKLTSKNKNGVRAEITLMRKYENDTLYFKKNFNESIPLTDFREVFEKPIKIEFDPIRKILFITSVDMEKGCTLEEHNILAKKGWNVSNIMYIRQSLFTEGKRQSWFRRMGESIINNKK